MENEVKNTEKEFEIITLWKVFCKSWILLVVCALLFSVFGFVYTHLFETDKYKGTAYFWVNSSHNSVNSSTTMGAAQMAANYMELIKTNMLPERAVRRSSLDAYWGCSEAEAVAKLKGMLSAKKSSTDSFIFSISATTLSRDEAYVVISAVQKAMLETIALINGEVSESAYSEYITLIGEVKSDGEIQFIPKAYVRNMAVFAMASLVLLYAVLLLYYIYDSVIYDEEIVKSSFAYPVVGKIPEWGNSGSAKRRFGKKEIIRDYDGRLLDDNTPFAVNESFNSLRTNVVYTMAGKPHPVIAVTSALSGVGKSTISANLALSFATLGKKTLLVECDMRCPSFGKMFSLEKREGISDYLGGLVDSVGDVLISVTENLTVVRAGKIPPNPSVLLASEAMKRFIETGKQNYDIVILDMPPICEVADAGIVSALVDGYILVVRSGVSDVKTVRQAEKSLNAVDGEIVGFILNDVSSKLLKGTSYYSTKKMVADNE